MFAEVLTLSLPALQNLQIQVHWQENNTIPDRVIESLGSLKGFEHLSSINPDLDLLIDSSVEDATTQLLELPSKVFPGDFDCLILTSVSPAFLEQLTSRFSQEERHDVLGELMTTQAMENCNMLMLETYEQPTAEAQATLQLIAMELATIDVDLQVWVKEKTREEMERVVWTPLAVEINSGDE